MWKKLQEGIRNKTAKCESAKMQFFSASSTSHYLSLIADHRCTSVFSTVASPASSSVINVIITTAVHLSYCFTYNIIII